MFHGVTFFLNCYLEKVKTLQSTFIWSLLFIVYMLIVASPIGVSVIELILQMQPLSVMMMPPSPTPLS